MKEFYQRHKTAIDRTAVVLVIIAALFLFFRVVFHYVALFVIGLVIAVILEPLAKLLHRKCRFPRWLAATA